MERALTHRPLIIQDENSAVDQKKAVADGKSRILKLNSKKGGGLETRKALNDITNKSAIQLDVSSKKKSSQNKNHDILEKGFLRNVSVSTKKKSVVDEIWNVAEEGFLHDHSKCIEAQKAACEPNFWDIVLPGHDSPPTSRPAKSHHHVDDRGCCPELEELSMPEILDWSDPSSWWKSPPSSPIRLDSSHVSPFSWDRPLELLLKE